LDIEILRGDLTEQKADAICNPASSLMSMGGGVAWALRRVGGVEIEQEALRYAPVPVGKAVATSVGKLSARWVVHAPTMESPAMPSNIDKVYRATKAALRCAEKIGARSIAMPGMGTGVGGVPSKEAAEAMLKAIEEFSSKAKSIRKVILCDINDEIISAWKHSLEKS